MFLSVHEQERLMVHLAGKLALERKERGLRQIGRASCRERV